MQINILSFQKHQNLSIVQFLSTPSNSFDYISGPKALENGLVEVKEINEQGSVNNLYLINLTDKYIFFMDGDILTGAKQNRVLNSSVMIAPNSKINLPVSCIEQGRWHSVSDKFNPSNHISPQKLRAKKSQSVSLNLKANRFHLADQNEVWHDVEGYYEAHRMSSSTMDLSELFTRKEDDFEIFIKKFELNTNSNGISLFVNKKLLSIDLFNRTDIYQEYFPKILRAAAIETFQLKEKENQITEAEATYKILNLFDTLETIKYETYPGVGIGTEKRFNTENITGFELNFNSHLIHLTLLNLKN